MKVVKVPKAEVANNSLCGSRGAGHYIHSIVRLSRVRCTAAEKLTARRCQGKINNLRHRNAKYLSINTSHCRNIDQRAS